PTKSRVSDRSSSARSTRTRTTPKAADCRLKRGEPNFGLSIHGPSWASCQFQRHNAALAGPSLRTKCDISTVKVLTITSRQFSNFVPWISSKALHVYISREKVIQQH